MAAVVIVGAGTGGDEPILERGPPQRPAPAAQAG
jgi:hypothetical protein